MSIPVDDHAEQLSHEARELDGEAAHHSETSKEGQRLRARAAELRVQAIGVKTYPVVICRACFHVTGWTGAAGHCDECLRRAQLHAAYADPHGGFVSVVDVRQRPSRPPAPPLRSRFAALVGRGEARDQATRREWIKLVEPDETGPISPETGYRVEVARRDQVAAADGSSTIVIRFTTATSRFDGAAWEQLDTTRIGRSAILVPTELSAALPVDQLAEAWGDYGNAVAAFNRTVWEQESATREGQRQSEQARRDALAEQQGITELLREQG
jgi:hypothetical protein